MDDEVLVDTSVWIEHFRSGSHDLADLLTDDRVVGHSVVIGEIAMGNLPDRATTLAGLRAIPKITELRPEAVYDFVERHRLYGLGLSWGDVQILASAVVSGISLWTTDKRLKNSADALGVSWSPPPI